MQATVKRLLTDLSDVELEAPLEEREEELQSGGLTLRRDPPISTNRRRTRNCAGLRWQPRHQQSHGQSAGHRTGAGRTRSPAWCWSPWRAGVPPRRRADAPLRPRDTAAAPHYALSIVRGRGIDTAALAWIAEHPSADVQFVDGWTGKGAIARELADAVEGAASRWEPGSVPGWPSSPTQVITDLFGTRDF